MILFLKAMFRYWWALMSCAAFTILGIWVVATNEGRDWALWSSLALSVAFLLLGAYKAWAKEHQLWLDERQKVEMLTATPDITGSMLM